MEGVERRKTRLSLGISDSKKDINKGINKESEEVKESPKVKKLKVDSSASKTKKCEETQLVENTPKKRGRGRPSMKSPANGQTPNTPNTPKTPKTPKTPSNSKTPQKTKSNFIQTQLSFTETPSKETATVSKRGRVSKKVETYRFDDDSHSEASENASEDEFQPDIEAEMETAESSESSIPSEISLETSIKSDEEDENDCLIIESPKKSRSPQKLLRPGSRSNRKSHQNSLIETVIDWVDTFDPNEVVEEWSYELDQESKVFTKPVLPALSEKAIKPYLCKESKLPKIVLYKCPFCEKIFTYTLVFCNHLYSCEKNTNVPDYLLFCSKHPSCQFTGVRRQEMINHFFKAHENQSPESLDSSLIPHNKQLNDSVNNEDFMPQMTKIKQNQLEVSRYYYIDQSEFKFTFNYFNKSIARNYLRLKYLTDFYLKQRTSPELLFNHYIINAPDTQSSQSTDDNHFDLAYDTDMTLKFQLPNEGSEPIEMLELKPFEVYNTSKANDPFSIINVANQIVALDWCPTKLRNNNSDQYLTFATLPSKEINAMFKTSSESIAVNLERNKINRILEAPNLIYICKFSNLNTISPDTDNSVEMFAVLNKKLGHVNCVKWRPDCGASISDEFNSSDLNEDNFNSTFIGYLLTASSNGNGYINLIQDLTKMVSFRKATASRKCNQGQVTSIKKLNVYENKRQIILQSNYMHGQCTAGDWSQLNGATEIALGYANGSVALFQINSNTLKDQLKINPIDENCPDLCIYSLKNFNAHQSYIKTLKWSKISSSILASGATNSRDIKCWDCKNTYKPMIEYEIFVTEFAFSLHSNDIFIVKEANLKGENHLFELDISFNVFNKERDETRSHSSLFYTDGSMNSMDQSDYFNKFIICDSRGHVILSSANNPKYWIPKHQLMYNSFSQVCRFDILDNSEIKQEDNTYQFNAAERDHKVIKIDLTRRTNDKKVSKQKNGQEMKVNSNRVDLNNLTTIRFNVNFDFLNWYATGSQSGFLFLQRLDELIVNLEE